MQIVTFVFLSLLTLCWQPHAVQGLDCEIRNAPSGTISNSQRVYYEEEYRGCWKITFPPSDYVRINLTELIFSDRDCIYVYLNISIEGSRERIRYCSKNIYHKIITAFGNVTIVHYIYSYQYSSTYISSRFNMSYHTESIVCRQNDSFRCSNHICIPRRKVCDGVKDCENGADEIGCEINKISRNRSDAIEWLKAQRKPYKGWGDETHRAIIALYLSGEMNFSTASVEEDLIAKQLELETALAILRNRTKPISSNEVSMFINALLITCHNPRKFHGYDLVQILKDHVTYYEKSPQPLTYLALCNADETLPNDVPWKLIQLLETGVGYPFYTDVQAMAVMAVSCILKSNKTDELFLGNNTLLSLYDETIEQFKALQQKDGSFGNIYTTALVTQAILSLEESNSTAWNLNATLNYVMNNFNSSNKNFLSVYLTLPILNSKSLPDIANVNCTGNTRRLGDVDDIKEIQKEIGPKMQVQYSLYVGDEKDVIHTIYLKIKENSTAHEVMELAAASDPKYKYQSHSISGVMYVYEILGIPNDPEHSRFWMLYLIYPDQKDLLVQSLESPDKLVLRDGDHLILWYKKFEI